MLSNTAKKAIEAYGGVELWQNHQFIEAEVSARGLAFTLKRRPVFDHAHIKMEINRPFSTLSPIGKNKNISGVMNGHDVQLINENGAVIEERKNARSFFPFGRRLFYWDDMDMAYFANYAFWNYFTLPRLLMNKSIQWTEKTAGVLEAVFPDNIPTHSRIQEFHFNQDNGRLIQHNYTVDIISKLATAANCVKEHELINGLAFPSSRLVTPRSKKGVALKAPVLIDMTIHSFRLSN